MMRASWSDPQLWERLYFKRIPQGWIYGSPIRWWPLGLSPHFLLSDTQKDEVTEVLGRSSWRLLIVLFALVLPAPVLWIGFHAWGHSPLGILLVFVLYGVFAQCVLNAYYWLALRTLLANAQPTSERITFGHRLNALAAIVPTGMLIFYGLLFAALVPLFGFQVLMSRDWDIVSLGSMLIVGCAAVYVLAMLAAKRRAKQFGS
jgi:hypothetical protein